MSVKIGRYRWFRKRTAYRSDFCLRCRSPQIAERYRTFDFLYLCYVPVIPLGFWEHWHCCQCSCNPHQRTHTKRWVKIVGAAVFGLLAAIYGILAWNNDTPWGVAVLFIAGSLVLVVMAVRHQPGISLEENLKQLPILDEETCLYCGGDLWGMPLQCEDCHLYQL